MFKIAKWHNNHQSPCVLMIDDLSDAYINVYPETYKNDWGFLTNADESLFRFLEDNLLKRFPKIKITFFVPYLRHAVINESCRYDIKKYDVGERAEFSRFLKHLIESGHEIAHHGSDHGKYIDLNKCTTQGNWIHEWGLFDDIEEGVRITQHGKDVFYKTTGVQITGGKYCGYVSRDNSSEIIDRCGFDYWCEIGRYQADETRFFGENKVFSFPTSFAGNTFVRLTYTTRRPSIDQKKRYLKYFQPLYNLTGFYRLWKLYRDGSIISVQEHISPSTSAGTVQSANIISDIDSLKKIFSFFESRSIWYATCNEITRYIYTRNNCSITIHDDSLVIHFNNIKNLSDSAVSVAFQDYFELHQNNTVYRSTFINKSHVVSIPLCTGINKFRLFKGIQ